MIGDQHVVTIESIAHGGHCVARLDGQVVFVRHTLPGERVRIEVTGQSKSYLRADAIEVLEPSALRVDPPCQYAGACGGCDFQHVSIPAQGDLLGAVVREQMWRNAGIDWTGAVESIDSTGLGWRTRMTYAVGDDGRLGLRRHRSHEVIQIDQCLIAHRGLPDVLAHRWNASTVETIVSNEDDTLIVVEEPAGRRPRVDSGGSVTTAGEQIHGRTGVTERVHDHRFRTSGSGFWQVHPRAAEVLVEAVLDGAQVKPGQAVADLYAGAGLFTAFLADAVGARGVVYSVEEDASAARDARRNLHAYGQVFLINASVDESLRSETMGPLDLVVLDPPRAGAGKSVRLIVAASPRRIVYVACDPASLARDIAQFAAHGYRLVSLRAFGLFPMTQHVECVAVLATD